MDSFGLARVNMVKGQVIPNKIVDRRLIDVMLDIPRHLFVPDDLKNIAYSDELLTVGDERYIIPPVLFAQMIQATEVKENEKCLVIAGGSGYSSAVFSCMCKKVVAIEPNSEMATKANYMIKKLDIGNVIVLNEKISEGHRDSAPYDVIFCNGAIDRVPHELLEQLAEGGRLVAIINNETGGHLMLFCKEDGIISKTDLFDATLPTMVDF